MQRSVGWDDLLELHGTTASLTENAYLVVQDSAEKLDPLIH